MVETYNEFIKRIEEKEENCRKCGSQMEHCKEIHTFVCKCGHREWYAERLGDNDANM